MTPSELYDEVSKRLAENAEIPPFDSSLSYCEALELHNKFYGWCMSINKLYEIFPRPYDVAVEIDPFTSISVPEHMRDMWWKYVHYPSEYSPEIDVVLKVFDQLYNDLTDRYRRTHVQYDDWCRSASSKCGYMFESYN